MTKYFLRTTPENGRVTISLTVDSRSLCRPIDSDITIEGWHFTGLTILEAIMICPDTRPDRYDCKYSTAVYKKPNNVLCLAQRDPSPTTACEPDEKLVSTLEDLLARARSGQLRSSVGVATTSDEQVLSWIAGTTQTPFVTSGALAHVAARYIQQTIDI
jgi:hypothetical protein